MNDPAQAIQQFADAYTGGEPDRVVGAFTEDGVIYYNGYATAGPEAIRRSLVMVGKFAFSVGRSIGDGDVQAVEGEMVPVVDGARHDESAVPYAAVAELARGGSAMRELRLYYDGKQLDQALAAHGLLQ